ncbi:MAG: glycoside hydrolase family 130 protein [Phycisphaerae bacterium]|nr:glycoside hydrolase family 130 protein [Phycisphaerae bacterium]
MGRAAGRDVMRRSRSNPLIELKHLPFRSSDIWNAAATRFEDEVLLLITVETLEGTYRIFRARSHDGERFTVDREPFMTSLETGPNQMYESMGIRDPRITFLEDTYYITYVADGDHGLRLGLARTRDFRSVEQAGYVSQVDVKGGALFPRKLGGRYAILKRPDAGCGIWVSYSDDLSYWGGERAVMTPRGGYWDPTRVGIGSPPIEIDQGWLLIYYGEKGTSAGPLVRLGAAILDRDDPSQVLARSNIPILSPRDRYERVGNVPNVVFSCGALLEDGHVMLYYGASDSCVCLATADLDDIVRTCMESKREY